EPVEVAVAVDIAERRSYPELSVAEHRVIETPKGSVAVVERQLYCSEITRDRDIGPQIAVDAREGAGEREVADLDLTVEVRTAGTPRELRDARLLADVHEADARFVGFVPPQVVRLMHA